MGHQDTTQSVYRTYCNCLIEKILNWFDKNLEIDKWKRLVIKIMSSETTTNNNQCQQCSKSFASAEELTRHMNQEHVGNA